MRNNTSESVFDINPKSHMISRTFHLNENQLEPLQKVSKTMGLSQSEVVRRSISLFIEEFSKRSKGAGKSQASDR